MAVSNKKDDIFIQKIAIELQNPVEFNCTDEQKIIILNIKSVNYFGFINVTPSTCCKFSKYFSPLRTKYST